MPKRRGAYELRVPIEKAISGDPWNLIRLKPA